MPAIRKHKKEMRSLKSAGLAAENDFLEHNRVSDSKLQFVHCTCDVTGCIYAEAVLDSLLFRLDIFSSFYLYIKHIFFGIGETQRV